MAWSDETRCLHCDGKLPLYRKITSGQFCSAVHRKAYWQDQERLAVERLHQTHDSLRAYRPSEALEAILGKPVGEPVGADIYYRGDALPKEEAKIDAEQIARSASNKGQVKFAGFLIEDKPALRAWEALLAAWDVEFAHWPMSAPCLPSSISSTDSINDQRLASASGLAMPLFQANGLAARIRAEAESAPVGFTTRLVMRVPFAAAPETPELSQHFLGTLRAAKVAAREPEPIPQVEETPFPFAERMAALPKIGAQGPSPAVNANVPEPLKTAWRANIARCDAAFATPVVAAVTHMQPLPLTNVPRTRAARAGAAGDTQPGDLHGYSQAMDLKVNIGAPWMNMAIPAAGPELRLASCSRYAILGSAGIATANVDSMHSAQVLDLCHEAASPVKQLGTQSLALGLHTAPGCRYEIRSQAGSIQPVTDMHRSGALSMDRSPEKELAAQSLELDLGTAPSCDYAMRSQPGMHSPLRDAQPLAARSVPCMATFPEGLGSAERNPVNAGAIPLAFSPSPCTPPAPRPVATGVAYVYASNAPMNPVAKFEPLEGAATPLLRQGFLAGWTQSLANAEERKHIWAHAADFWQHAPRDLKLLAIAIPILLGLALRPSLPKVRVTAPVSTDGISKNIGDGFRQQFVNVRNSVSERAAVSLNEDFRSGLDNWQARGDLSTGWSFDENGFVRPGSLALYRPSLGLTDYEMEFLGLIDKKAMSWVVRAADFDNYYVVKVVVMKAGPLPTIGITRYAVVDGKAQSHVDTVAAINARPDMLYRVTLNVHEDTFLLALQGKIVDTWSESRLKRGGVGFFSPRGEESRLRWVQVTHQYDMLGRLCAYLAPYNIPTTTGSW